MFDFLDMTELSGFDIKFGGILPGKTGQDIDWTRLIMRLIRLLILIRLIRPIRLKILIRLTYKTYKTNKTHKTYKTNKTYKTEQKNAPSLAVTG